MDAEISKAIYDLKIEMTRALDECTDQLVGGEEFDEAVERIKHEADRLENNDQAHTKAVKELFIAYKDMLNRLEEVEYTARDHDRRLEALESTAKYGETYVHPSENENT